MVTCRSRIVLAGAVAAASCAAGAARPAAAPVARTLLAADGTTVPLDELWGTRDATVLVFWSPGCPCVRRYQARVEALRERFPPERVRVIGVSSNAGDDYARVLSVARERGVTIPIYRDEGGAVASSWGVRSTPTVVVVDRRGAVRYLGWIDNERSPGDEGREPWLEQALDAVLDGHGDYPSRTPTWGCAITRSLFGSGDACCAGAQPKSEVRP